MFTDYRDPIFYRAYIHDASKNIYNYGRATEIGGSGNIFTIIHKSDFDLTTQWIKIYDIMPNKNAVMVTQDEASLYFLQNKPFSFILHRISTSDGSFQKTYKGPNMKNGNSSKFFMNPDGTSMYVTCFLNSKGAL